MRLLHRFGICLLLFSCATPDAKTPAPAPANAPIANFRIAFGSCNHQDKPQTHWTQILQKQPQVWVWLGDNVYGDTTSEAVMQSKYKKLLNNPEYKAFSAQVRITGTWDDHDYGKNDAGGEFRFKKKSKDLFWDFMQVPRDSVLRAQDGVYRSELWTIGQRRVKLILLDARYNREPVKFNQYHEYVPTDGDILGAAQWAWLEKEMADAATLDGIVIANGTQVLSSLHRFEKWANFPKARERLLKLVEESPVKLKIFISGDRHLGEISQLKFGNGSQVAEVTSSGLTHTYEKASEENPLRVGPLWTKTHYGLIDFTDDGTRLKAVLSLQDLATRSEAARLELN